MIVGLWSVAMAVCPTVEVAAFDAGPAPVVVVLGERHGHRRELRRAATLVSRLRSAGPVTVALEAVRGDLQGTLDGFGSSASRAEVRRGLRWEETWGFSFAAYWPTLRTARDGVRLVAAGLPLGPAPEDAEVPIPSGYADDLAEAMAGHDLTPEVASRFARSMAWRDLRIAQQAVQGWDGRGSLVILTGRGHVEGGKGVPFQLGPMTKARVVSVLLASEDATCPAGEVALTGG